MKSGSLEIRQGVSWVCSGHAISHMAAGAFLTTGLLQSDPRSPFLLPSPGTRSMNFRRHPDDGPGLRGRRIDIIRRLTPMPRRESTMKSVQRAISAKAQRKAAGLVAKRLVVATEPEGELGRVIWNPQKDPLNHPARSRGSKLQRRLAQGQ